MAGKKEKQKNKKNIKVQVRDLKPSKDAKGGGATNVSTNASTSSRSIHSRQIQRRGDG